MSKCPHCGASMKKYWHTLSKGLVDSFVEFARIVRTRQTNKVHITKETNFNVNQWCNFKKLKYFGLIAKCKDGEKKSGYWLITRRGLEFLKGKVEVSKKVQTYRGVKVAESDEKTLISQYYDGTMSHEEYWEKEFQFEIHQSKLF